LETKVKQIIFCRFLYIYSSAKVVLFILQTYLSGKEEEEEQKSKKLFCLALLTAMSTWRSKEKA